MVLEWFAQSGIGAILMVLSENTFQFLCSLSSRLTQYSYSSSSFLHFSPPVGITGEVYVNQNGDRETDYTINDLDPVTGVMSPVGTFFGRNESYTLNLGSAVHWPSINNKQPLDLPSCGYLGDASHCLSKGIHKPILHLTIRNSRNLELSRVLQFAIGQ